MPHRAEWWDALEDKRVRCRLCPRGCVVAEGGAGACLGRVNQGGALYAETYARPASVALDPIEKKPLYHFCPGASILSLGTYGCNFKCSFCQNWNLSQAKTPTREVRAEAAVAEAKRAGACGIAYTYNEPTVWAEYVRDCAVVARAAGLKNVLVTNGYIMPEPLAELLPYIDALNIDIKSFREDFYTRLCGGHLQPVLDTAQAAAKFSHVEITNLVIEGENDSPKEQSELADWIARELGRETPVHLSAHFPRYKLKAPPTQAETLLAARERFREKLDFVYLGNVRVEGADDTVCPACGKVAVLREGYRTQVIGLDGGNCAGCGRGLGMVRI